LKIIFPNPKLDIIGVYLDKVLIHSFFFAHHNLSFGFSAQQPNPNPLTLTLTLQAVLANPHCRKLLHQFTNGLGAIAALTTQATRSFNKRLKVTDNFPSLD
jgi:hypothetical protein